MSLKLTCFGFLENVIVRCCIESFLNSVIEGNLNYQENINPGYNTLAIYASLQTAIQSFVDKFIVVPTASSSAVALKMGNRGNKGNVIAFSYADSSSWISSQQDVLTSMLSALLFPFPLPLQNSTNDSWKIIIFAA